MRRVARQAPPGRPLGLLLPDSLSSALSFRLAGIACAGYRDDGRSLLLRWPFAKPAGPLHAVQSWYHLTRHALAQWRLPDPPPQRADELGWQVAAAHEDEAARALSQAGLASGGLRADRAHGHGPAPGPRQGLAGRSTA